MKRIGLLGGTSWPSTIEYYRMINQMVAGRLGGRHSADLLLRSIDYHPIASRYESRWNEIPTLLEQELRLMQALPCDGLILCNNTLHKAYDEIRDRVALTIPFFHAVELSAKAAKERGMKHLLLLATRFTLEDGFFQKGLEKAELEVVIPEPKERDEIQAIQSRLAADEMRPEFREYFTALLKKYAHADAAVLACTELPLAIPPEGTPIPTLNSVYLQSRAAVDFALS
jgi:aspartate racemase